MFATLDNINIYYEINEKKPIPVLLLHGWGCTTQTYKPVISNLSSSFSTLCLDFPGHGKSDEPLHNYTVSDFMQIVLDLLDTLNIHKVNIIAHSFGARVAIKLAATHPELINKMVITGGAGIKKNQSNTQTRKQKIYKQRKNFLNKVSRLKLFNGIIENLQEKLIQKYGSSDYAALSKSMRGTFINIINEDLTEYLSQIKSSTLLIWGDKDTETPLDFAKIMDGKIPDSGLVVFENSGHFAFLEQIDRFNKIVQYFFSEGK